MKSLFGLKSKTRRASDCRRASGNLVPPRPSRYQQMSQQTASGMKPFGGVTIQASEGELRLGVDSGLGRVLSPEEVAVVQEAAREEREKPVGLRSASMNEFFSGAFEGKEPTMADAMTLERNLSKK